MGSPRPGRKAGPRQPAGGPPLAKDRVPSKERGLRPVAPDCFLVRLYVGRRHELNRSFRWHVRLRSGARLWHFGPRRRSLLRTLHRGFGSQLRLVGAEQLDRAFGLPRRAAASARALREKRPVLCPQLEVLP